MTKRVIAYIRVSTEGQVDKYGLEAQEKDIRVYCARNDMEILEWRIERGVSGVKEDRPEFNKILYGEIGSDGCTSGEATNPPVDAVVVAKNDRVARDINVYYYFKMLLKKKGIELISCAEDFGEFGMMAHFLEAFTLCVAEMERENITRRTSAGRNVKAKSGGFAGGGVPYGYDCVDRELVVNPEQAECVRLVYQMRESGRTMKEIADYLNFETAYTTKRGGKFGTSTIQNILKNEAVYRGKIRYNGEHEGTQEKIL